MDIAKALANADRKKSKLTDGVIQKLTGLSSERIWHLLNNLASQSDSYLEIGTYYGSTLISALHGNKLYAVACDNFCMKEKSRGHFLKNTEQYKFKFYDMDCFTIDLTEFEKKIRLYFFDGRHEYKDQFRALDYFLPVLTDEFVFVVDDWNMAPVKDGTLDAIGKNNLTIVEKYELGDTKKMKDFEGWWCGLAIFKLKKNAE